MAGSCKVYATWRMCTQLSEILNHNERSCPPLGTQMNTKLQTVGHIHCCHGWLTSLPQNLLHSHCSNTVNISAVVMLGCYLCQFNTGRLVLGCVCHHQQSFLFGYSNVMYVVQVTDCDGCGLSVFGCPLCDFKMDSLGPRFCFCQCHFFCLTFWNVSMAFEVRWTYGP